MEIWNLIWNFEYALVPCAIAYLIFDVPIVIRRLTRRFYAPIYFAFFPFGFSDELYARYFDEDEYYLFGGPYQKSERQNARIRIIWASVLSLTLTMAVSPFLSALFAYFFLSEVQFGQFFWTLAAIKAALLFMSLYDLRWKYRITDVVPISHIALVYIVYWVLILMFLDRSFVWINNQMLQGGIKLMAQNLLDYVVFEIGLGILFVAVLGWLIPWRITNAYASIDDETDT